MVRLIGQEIRYFPKRVLLKLLDERKAQISSNTNYNLQRPVQMFVYCL